jgi:hypothetical protein
MSTAFIASTVAVIFTQKRAPSAVPELPDQLSASMVTPTGAGGEVGMLDAIRKSASRHHGHSISTKVD